MKQFVYPAICYNDVENETITLLLPDTDIVASGADVEEAFWAAKDYLKSFVDWSIKFDADIPTASTFAQTAKLNPKKAVLLVDVESKSKKADAVKAEQKFQSFVQEFFD